MESALEVKNGDHLSATKKNDPFIAQNRHAAFVSRLAVSHLSEVTDRFDWDATEGMISFPPWDGMDWTVVCFQNSSGF